jgi:DNA-binding GntR family transcriptional regulator
MLCAHCIQRAPTFHGTDRLPGKAVTLIVRDASLGTRHEHVYATLRQDVLLGRFAGGERLVEMALAQRYEVSRTPIREALFRLAQEGLVDLMSHGGAVVKKVLEREIVEAYLTRSVLEGLAGSLAAREAGAADILEMEYIVRRTRLAMEEENLLAVLDSNSAFHEALSGLSRNAFLIRQLRRMHPYTYFFRRNMLRAVGSSAEARSVYLAHLQENLAEHDQIVHLLRERRSTDLDTLLRRHMVKSSDCMLAMLAIVRREGPAGGGAGGIDDPLKHLPELTSDVALHLLSGVTTTAGLGTEAVKQNMNARGALT